MPGDGDLTEIGYQLHERLIAGDLTATAEIAEIFFPAVTKRLEGGYRNLDDHHLVDMSVTDALMNYFQDPSKYDPNKLDLLGYLRMSANWDLINGLNKEKKHRIQLRISENVELSEDDSEHGVEIRSDVDVEKEVETKLSPSWAILEKSLPDPLDQELVFLIMFGVRNTYWYAQVLGIQDQSEAKQRKIVKRAKDRIKKVLFRNIDPDDLRE